MLKRIIHVSIVLMMLLSTIGLNAYFTNEVEYTAKADGGEFDGVFIDDFDVNIIDNSYIDQSSIKGVLWDGSSSYYGSGSFGSILKTLAV